MKLFPQKFTLTIAESEHGGWFVTTDAHKGYLHFIPPEEGLPEGLRQVPAGLRQILVAQIDVDNAKKSKELPICSTCNQPDYCRAQAECHYTGSPMLNPDGTHNTLR